MNDYQIIHRNTSREHRLLVALVVLLLIALPLHHLAWRIEYAFAIRDLQDQVQRLQETANSAVAGQETYASALRRLQQENATCRDALVSRAQDAQERPKPPKSQL